jgi:valine--pyruvate aminotransferase
MKLSAFGQKFTRPSGILQLMEDLGNALSNANDMLILGGGNPAHIPEVQFYFRERMQTILQEPGLFEAIIGNYDTAQGKKEFIESLAELLVNECHWDISADNIALTNGSQTAFFVLLNMFAGIYPDGSHKKVLLPLTPEYIGYEDIGLVEGFFTANRPEIEFLDNRQFKYHINFNTLSLTDEIGAICVSRPTNPTGNVLTDPEIATLSDLARQHDIPLVIDNAYGTPFPHIIYTDATPVFNEHIILCMSLSKLGLPATRTGIIIANEEIIKAVSGLNAVISLAPGGLGAALALDLVRTGQVIRVSQDLIKPYYARKAEQAVAYLHRQLDGIDYYIHRPEGAFFLWLWLKDLPITCEVLYERLKKKQVLVLPGHYFFPGLLADWAHKHECIRITYAQDDAIVAQGIAIIAEEVKRAYQGR